MSRWLLLLFLFVSSANAADCGGADEPRLDFVVGRYRLLGQAPDRGIVYGGTARIVRTAAGVDLLRSVGGRNERIAGVVRRADPGEACVLAPKWRRGGRALEMICLIASDLDNYARLSCHWGHAGNPHRQPGMEAYFAREPWE